MNQVWEGTVNKFGSHALWVNPYCKVLYATDSLSIILQILQCYGEIHGPLICIVGISGLDFDPVVPIFNGCRRDLIQNIRGLHSSPSEDSSSGQLTSEFILSWPAIIASVLRHPICIVGPHLSAVKIATDSHYVNWQINGGRVSSTLNKG
jgi:hypothetical protein